MDHSILKLLQPDEEETEYAVIPMIRQRIRPSTFNFFRSPLACRL